MCELGLGHTAVQQSSHPCLTLDHSLQELHHSCLTRQVDSCKLPHKLPAHAVTRLQLRHLQHHSSSGHRQATHTEELQPLDRIAAVPAHTDKALSLALAADAGTQPTSKKGGATL